MSISCHSKTHHHPHCGTGVEMLQRLPALNSLEGMPWGKVYGTRVHYNLPFVFICDFHVDNLSTPPNTSFPVQCMMTPDMFPRLSRQLSKAIIQSACICCVLLYVMNHTQFPLISLLARLRMDSPPISEPAIPPGRRFLVANHKHCTTRPRQR